MRSLCILRARRGDTGGALVSTPPAAEHSVCPFRCSAPRLSSNGLFLRRNSLLAARRHTSLFNGGKAERDGRVRLFDRCSSAATRKTETPASATGTSGRSCATRLTAYRYHGVGRATSTTERFSAATAARRLELNGGAAALAIRWEHRGVRPRGPAD
jgi:hypothetical protein